MGSVRDGTVPSAIPELVLAFLDGSPGSTCDGDDGSWVFGDQTTLFACEGFQTGVDVEGGLGVQQIIAHHLSGVGKVPVLIRSVFY